MELGRTGPVQPWTHVREVDPPQRVVWRDRKLGTGTGMLTRWARRVDLPREGWFGYVKHDESPRCTWFPADDLAPLT